MIRILTTTLFLIYGLTIFGQVISVDTMFLPKAEKNTYFQDDNLKFPIIRTGNLQIDNSMNKDLKNRFTNNEFPDLPTDSTIIKWADENVDYLDFEVTFIKNELISLNISAEWCGAYCTGWTDYFTYDLTTGKYLTINEIVDTTGKFRTLILSDKDKQYEEQKIELKKMLLDKDSEHDEDTYNWVLEQYETCDSEFVLNSFALHSEHIEIIDKCYLPNIVKSLTPVIVLKYKYDDIKEHLKIKN